MHFRFTDHALYEIERRQIPMELVRETLDLPEQIVPERRGRLCYQARKVFPNGREYLVRAIVDPADATVRTVYHTSKVTKYWRVE